MTRKGAALDRLRLARLITAIENRSPSSEAALRRAYRRAPHAQIVGVTGPSGVGKSTLIDGLVDFWARQGGLIAIVSIDPSSPFSGGALLGDRIRMDRSARHDNVYHRSLASRGQFGGLSEAAIDVLVVLGDAGFDRIVIETVGTGQSETEVMAATDCVVVVNVPGLGDQVQASKAGQMEIGDIYVVNKFDLPRAERALMQVRRALDTTHMGDAGVNRWQTATRSVADVSAGAAEVNRRHGDPASEGECWRPPVLPVTAMHAEGISALAAAIDIFQVWSIRTGRAEMRHAYRVREQLLRVLSAGMLRLLADEPTRLADHVSQILAGVKSPAEAADLIMQEGFSPR